MIWVPSTTDDQVYMYMEDGVMTGTVRRMENSKSYIASTNKLYLGQYKTLKNAQLAVETKRAKECKTAGKIIT